MQARPISRRHFIQRVSLAAAQLSALSATSLSTAAEQHAAGSKTHPYKEAPMTESHSDSDEIIKEKIRRARLSGPPAVTRDATVVELHRDGSKTVLQEGTNHWVCVPGNENIIGQVDMCLDPMGMQWMMDLMARKPTPTNSAPGLIYMLNGAIQHSFTDPFDTTSPAIPIGPHWMLL